MKKYLVVVNESKLISVWARSHGGAEQAIFQACRNRGIASCQAFSIADLSTDTFREYADKCNTMSLSEFSAMAHKACELTDNLVSMGTRYAEAKETQNELERFIENLQAEMEDAQKKLTEQLHQMNYVEEG